MLNPRLNSKEWQLKNSDMSTIAWARKAMASRLQNVDLYGYKSLVRKVLWMHHLLSVMLTIRPWFPTLIRNILQLIVTKLMLTCQGHFLTRPFSRTIKIRRKEKIRLKSSLDKKFLTLFSVSVQPMLIATPISATAKASTSSLDVSCKWWRKKKPSGHSVVSLRTSCQLTTFRIWWARGLIKTSLNCWSRKSSHVYMHT